VPGRLLDLASPRRVDGFEIRMVRVDERREAEGPVLARPRLAVGIRREVRRERRSAGAEDLLRALEGDAPDDHRDAWCPAHASSDPTGAARFEGRAPRA